MCGILGFNQHDKKKGYDLIKLFEHRGPDNQSVYSDNHVTLAHSRLSIIDLTKSANQPMNSPDDNIIITFNGEIFNYQELRKILISHGYNFKTNSDTEVLLYAYEEWGIKLLDILNGQFAFCIYDKVKQQLFLARDHSGILPLYYYDDGFTFVFASELKVLMQYGLNKVINKKVLDYYFMFGHTPTDKTIFNNIFKLKPAHCMVYDLTRSKIKFISRYWKIKKNNIPTNEHNAKNLILYNLDYSVQQRMVADVPVGAFLSGGVDSSAVVAMMSKYTDKLNTFSIGFEHKDYDESMYAHIIADKFKTNHHNYILHGPDVKRIIPELSYYYDEPFADPSMIPTYFLAEHARNKVKVVLTGDGGDELFGGYNRYRNYYLLNMIKLCPPKLLHILKAILTKFKLNISYLDRALVQSEHRYINLLNSLKPDEINQLISSVKQCYSMNNIISDDHWLNHATLTDFHNYLPADILTKVDRACMAHNLESRPPFLNRNMIELAYMIHPNLKFKRGQSKYILKQAFKGILPECVLHRTKQGFGIPLDYYFKNDLKNIVQKYVLDYKTEHIPNTKFLNNASTNLSFRVLMFNLWYDRWMK